MPGSTSARQRSRSARLGEAIVALRKALELSPDASDARLYLTSAYLGTGQFALAREQATLLAEKLPQVPQVWVLLTVANAGLGDRDAATASYTRLKSLNPAAATALRTRLAALPGNQAVNLPE
jgi:tetratricopeptide (TPR) repeat protein